MSLVRTDIGASLACLRPVVASVTSYEPCFWTLKAGLHLPHPHPTPALFNESSLCTQLLEELVGVVLVEHMGCQESGSGPGPGCRGNSHLFL